MKKRINKNISNFIRIFVFCFLLIMQNGCVLDEDARSSDSSMSATHSNAEKADDTNTSYTGEDKEEHVVNETDFAKDTERTEILPSQEKDKSENEKEEVEQEEKTILSMQSVPQYNGMPYVIINDNQPFFQEKDLTIEVFENYSDFDQYGRCGIAYANICKELMPTEPRGEIGFVRPTGWKTVKYNGVVEGNYLYNRCHLIGYQLAGENANEQNLITGTRYMNVEGMLPFENQVADYVEKTGNHVIYRVTPIFEGANLVASGVLMEAKSVEDKGIGICYNVFVYNVQPGIEIDYANGESQLMKGWSTELESASSNSEEKRNSSGYNKEVEVSSDTTKADDTDVKNEKILDYVVNTNTGKFHNPHCNSVTQMKEKNRMDYKGSREELISRGYKPCHNCNP